MASSASLATFNASSWIEEASFFPSTAAWPLLPDACSAQTNTSGALFCRCAATACWATSFWCCASPAAGILATLPALEARQPLCAPPLLASNTLWLLLIDPSAMRESSPADSAVFGARIGVGGWDGDAFRKVGVLPKFGNISPAQSAVNATRIPPLLPSVPLANPTSPAHERPSTLKVREILKNATVRLRFQTFKISTYAISGQPV